MKTCTVCKLEKPAIDFPVMSHASDGLHFHCRACLAVRRIADREKRRAYNARWKAENPEKAAALKERHVTRARERKAAVKAANMAASAAYVEPPKPPREKRASVQMPPGVRRKQTIKRRLAGKAAREAAIVALGGKCARCGWSGPGVGFDVHHNDEDGAEHRRGRKDHQIFRDVVADPGRFTLFCAICHRLHHYGEGVE